MMWPLISDTVGATPSPFHFQEYSKDSRVEVGSESVQEAEVSELPLEILGEVLGWKESTAVLEIPGEAPE